MKADTDQINLPEKNISVPPWIRFWIDRSGWFWGLLLGVTLWKFLAGWMVGLIFDECYYWAWSLHPQACYLDHPPLTAWLIASGHQLLGHTPLAVRLWAILSGVILALAGRSLAAGMFGPAAGNRAGIFLLLAPIFAGNALLMTPDTFLAASWGVALLCAWRGSREHASFLWWIATGAAAGLGMLSKYTMVLFYLSLGVLWIASPGGRKRLFFGGLVAGCVSLLFFLPVILWNASHDWVSFQHQLHHGFSNEHKTLINVGNLANYALFLIVLVSPGLGLLCFRTAGSRMINERFRFLGVFFWTVIVFFGYSAGKAHVEANWPMTAFISGLIMVAGDWERYGRSWRYIALILLLVAGIGAVAGISFLSLPKEWSLGLRSATVDTSPLKKLPRGETLSAAASQGIGELQARFSEVLGPEEVAAAVSKEFRVSGADFLCADTYQTFGVLTFYAPELEPVLWLPIRGRARFPWIDERQWAGKTGLTAEWPRSGCNFAWLYDGETLWSRKIHLPGITRPLTLTLNKGYDPKRVRE